jgi:hypothetical protein
MMTNSQPRIAIVGNMNNGGFAIMRYFRDLGADAYLLPYLTDGSGNLAHFAPEADSWTIERWQPFIRQLNFPNTTEAVFGRLYGLRHSLISIALWVLGSHLRCSNASGRHWISSSHTARALSSTAT